MPAPEFGYKILTVAEYDGIKHLIPSAVGGAGPSPPPPTTAKWQGTALDVSDGFMHLSTAPQSLVVANRFFGSQTTLVVLEIPLARVAASVRWEDPASPDMSMRAQEQAEMAALRAEHAAKVAKGTAFEDAPLGFPHIYGGLDLAVVGRVVTAHRAAGEAWTAAWLPVTAMNAASRSYGVVHVSGAGRGRGGADGFLDHCARVFAGVPRALFADHWHLDPLRDPTGVLLAMDSGQSAVAASVRVYSRSMAVGAYGHVAVGAVGDVGTAPEHRRRGLAAMLMDKSIEYMASRQMHVGFLHTNPASPAFSLYLSRGWVPWPLLQSTWTGVITHTPTASVAVQLRDDVQMAQWMHALYATYASNKVGLFQRPGAEYWTQWIGSRTDPRYRLVVRASTDHSAYVILQQPINNPRTLFLCEVVSDSVQVSARLLADAVADLGLLGSDSVSISFATGLVSGSELDAFGSALGVGTLATTGDKGWMVRLVSPFSITHPSTQSVVSIGSEQQFIDWAERAAQDGGHVPLFLRTDKF